jgi:hypothetical protein
MSYMGRNLFRCSFLCLLFGLLPIAGGQQHSTKCAQQRAIAELLSSNAIQNLASHAHNPDLPFAVRLYAAYRVFELNPHSKDAAMKFLNLLPKTEQEGISIYEISGHDCDTTAAEDLKLDTGYEGLEPLAARAILLTPVEMDTYVRYGLVTTMDVHSHYGSRSVPVCRSFPTLFRSAVDRLPKKDRAWFDRHILDPRNCRVMMAEEE